MCKNPKSKIQNPKSEHIGTLAEKSLHAALKRWYAEPGDRLEVRVDSFVIDIVRDELLIEIQTRNFSAMKRKLARLLEDHPVRVLHPISREKWIVRQTAEGEPLQRRKSPKRGQPLEIFKELVYIPHLLTHPNLTIEVLLTREEEIWRDDGQGSWRRKRWSLFDRQLLEVVGQTAFATIKDWLDVLPPTLVQQPFTNRELAAALQIRLALAQKVNYTLRKMELLQVVGKQGRANLYEVSF